MKIRMDFVTNSSSSSFIIARKEEISEKLKKTIVDYVMQNMLGRKILTPDCTEEQIRQVFKEEYVNDEEQREIREALKEGKTIYGGWVNFECCEENYAELFADLWSELEKAGGGEFITIDRDLDY